LKAPIKTKESTYRILVGVLMVVFLTHCVSEEDPENPIMVSVYNYDLRKKEFEEMLPSSLQKEDSAAVADQLINKWISEKAVLSRAEQNLLEKDKDFSAKLEDYRNSLVLYTYERELVNQKLDTMVSDKEIETFFNENAESFKLKNAILKPWFIMVGKDAPNLKRLKKWFNGNSEKDLEALDDYCNQYAEKCYFDQTSWMYVDDLLKEVPLEMNDWSQFLKSQNYLEFEKDGNLYLLRVFDYRLRGSDAPLELERQKVQNLILNKRKAELIKRMREDALQEAYSKNKVTLIKE
jgi:hypothetical protein